MKLYQLALDYDLYPEHAGHWIVVSNDGNHELSKPLATIEEAKIERAKLNPDYCENIISLKMGHDGRPNISALGVLAMKALYSPAMKGLLEDVFLSVKHKRTNNRAWVYEYDRPQFILKAGQPTKQQAALYMQKNAVLVFFLEG